MFVQPAASQTDLLRRLVRRLLRSVLRLLLLELLLLRRSLARVARSVLRLLLLLLLRRLVVVGLLRVELLLLLHHRRSHGGHRRGSGRLLRGDDGRRDGRGRGGGGRVDARLVRGESHGSSGQTGSLKHDGQAELSSLLGEVALVLELVPARLARQIERVQRQIQAADVIVAQGGLVPHVGVQQLLLALQVEDVALLPHGVLVLILSDLCGSATGTARQHRQSACAQSRSPPHSSVPFECRAVNALFVVVRLSPLCRSYACVLRPRCAVLWLCADWS